MMGSTLGMHHGNSTHSRAESLSERVEHFLQSNDVDDRAATALRESAPDVQIDVIERGLRGARNPSSALLARIRNAEASMPNDNIHDDAFHRGPSPFEERRRIQGKVEGFIRLHELPGGPADALRDCDPEVQEIVMDRGINGARNPSMALFARIRDAKAELHNSHWRARVADEVEYFLRKNDVSDSAADALRRCDPDVQETVMHRGIHNANNPSAALHARIKDALRQRDIPPTPPAPFGGMHGPIPKRRRIEDDVENFIRANDVDTIAADMLRNCGPELQEAVMERGVKTAKNPSSALTARIRAMRQHFTSDGLQSHGSAPPSRHRERYAPY